MTARILEQGYRRYEGERRGEPHAVRSLVFHTLRRMLGLRRPARWKILPVMTIVFAYLPAIVFLGVIALVTEAGDFVPNYADYYGFIFSAIVLFVAFAAPEALCPDRRSQVLSLYLASPLTRGTYLMAKAIAVAAIIALVTIGPPLLLLLGRILQEAGPDGPLGVLGVLGRVVGAGAMLATFYTALSLAVSSLTDRRAVAAAGVLLLILASAIATNILRFGLDAPAEVMVLNLTFAPAETVSRIYGSPGEIPELGTVQLAAGLLALAVVSGAVTFWRYHTLRVTR